VCILEALLEFSSRAVERCGSVGRLVVMTYLWVLLIIPEIRVLLPTENNLLQVSQVTNGMRISSERFAQVKDAVVHVDLNHVAVCTLGKVSEGLVSVASPGPFLVIHLLISTS